MTYVPPVPSKPQDLKDVMKQVADNLKASYDDKPSKYIYSRRNKTGTYSLRATTTNEYWGPYSIIFGVIAKWQLDGILHSPLTWSEFVDWVRMHPESDFVRYLRSYGIDLDVIPGLDNMNECNYDPEDEKVFHAYVPGGGAVGDTVSEKRANTFLRERNELSNKLMQERDDSAAEISNLNEQLKKAQSKQASYLVELKGLRSKSTKDQYAIDQIQKPLVTQIKALTDQVEDLQQYNNTLIKTYNDSLKTSRMNDTPVATIGDFTKYVLPVLRSAISDEAKNLISQYGKPSWSYTDEWQAKMAERAEVMQHKEIVHKYELQKDKNGFAHDLRLHAQKTLAMQTFIRWASITMMVFGLYYSNAISLLNQ